MLTVETARSLFTYSDGKLFWAVTKGRAVSGREAGWWQPSSDGRRTYRKVEVDGVTYPVHRVIFLLHYGYLPEIVDHVDRDPTNNRIGNLRAATKAENNRNIAYARTNASGVRGVDYHKGAWRARVSVNGASVFNQRFKTREEAEAAVIQARQKLHTTFAT